LNKQKLDAAKEMEAQYNKKIAEYEKKYVKEIGGLQRKLN